MAYEIPYDSNYGEWYGVPQNVTRLSATLEQTLDEDGNSIGLITASWNMPDNGGTFVAQLSTDGTEYHIAETNIRQNNVVLVVEANTDYYLKIITVLGSEQSSGVESSLLSAGVSEIPATPIVVAVQGGMQINVGTIPFGYSVEISISDGTDTTVLYTTESIVSYNCDAGTYSVSTAYVNAVNDIGTSSSSASVTVTELAPAGDLDDYVAKTSADYLKSASVSGNTLTLTKGDDNTVTFTPSGGGGGSYTAGDGIDITNDTISLEVASANDIGGVKVGNGLSIDANGVLSATGGGGGGSYTAGDGIDITSGVISLETASANSIGGIKVGNGLSIDATGVLSVTGGGSGSSAIIKYGTALGSNFSSGSCQVTFDSAMPDADYSISLTTTGGDPWTTNYKTYSKTVNGFYIYTSSSVNPGLRIDWIAVHSDSGGGGGGTTYTAGDGIDISNDTISLKTASANDIGGIKVGSGLSIDANGVLSATGGGGLSPSDITTGSTNGTISVDGTDVAVYGLGSNAYSSTSYLPLAGGTMTGGISTDVDTALVRSVDNSAIRIIGGSDSTKGAWISLCGKDRTTQAGEFILRATDGTNTKDLDGKPDGTLTWGGVDLLPVGVVQAFAGSTTPTGWLLCDGSSVSRTTYAKLFAVIGTTYGSGDGSTTFNLPNLTDKFIQGNSTSGTVKTAGLPNITGYFEPRNMGNNSTCISPNGAFNSASRNVTSYTPLQASSTAVTVRQQISFEASSSNAIYGNSTTVQPPALTMRYIIKY